MHLDGSMLRHLSTLLGQVAPTRVRGTARPRFRDNRVPFRVRGRAAYVQPWTRLGRIMRSTS